MNADIEVSLSWEYMYAKGVTEKGKAILADHFCALDVNEGYPFGAGMVDKFKKTFTGLGFVVHIVS